MDQLAAMRAFTRIVETGSFTRAADSLDMPKATVTKLIQQLEAHLRASLLSRSTRRLAVTADGAAYYDRAARLLAELDELDGSLSAAQVQPRGRLRVDVLAVLARDVILPALPEFLDRYPDIQVDLGASDRAADLLAENVDCVIRGGTITDPSLIARRLADIALVACAAPRYLERHGAPAHPDEIGRGHVLVGYFNVTTGRLYDVGFAREGTRLAVSGPCRVAVNEIGALVAATLAGQGIAQLPAFLARPHLEAGRLLPVLPGWDTSPIPLHVVYPPHRHLSNKLRVFVDWVAGLFAATRF